MLACSVAQRELEEIKNQHVAGSIFSTSLEEVLRLETLTRNPFAPPPKNSMYSMEVSA